MAKTYVLRAPAGVLILGSSVTVPATNANFQVRKGDAALQANKGGASMQVRKGDATFTEGK